MIEVRSYSRYSNHARISDAPTVREAYKVELKAMRKAGWQVHGSRCTDSIGAIMAERWGMEVRVLIAPRKPRKVGVFEKFWKKIAKIFGG